MKIKRNYYVWYNSLQLFHVTENARPILTANLTSVTVNQDTRVMLTLVQDALVSHLQ